MENRELTNNQSSSHPNPGNATNAMINGQNLSRSPFPGKEQIKGASDLRFPAGGKQDSPDCPPKFAHATHPHLPQPINQRPPADPQLTSAEASKALPPRLDRAHQAQAESSTDPSKQASRSDTVNTLGCNSAPSVSEPSKTCKDGVGSSNTVKEVTDFVQGNGAGAGGLADSAANAALASFAGTNSRGQQHMMSYPTQAQPMGQQMGQQIMNQPGFTNYLHLAQGQSDNLIQIPIILGTQQPQPHFQSQFQQLVQIVPTHVHNDGMMHGQQLFVQQMAEQAQFQQMQQMVPTIIVEQPKELTLEMLLRQMDQQMFLQQQQMQQQNAVQNLEQLTRNLAQGMFCNGDKNLGFFQKGICNVCNQEGELIRCSLCKKAFHKQCAGVSVATQEWECEECKTMSRESLLRQLKEKAQKKILERERRKQEELQAKIEAKMRRENEAKQRKEEKEKQREEQKKMKQDIMQQQVTIKKEESLKAKLAAATGIAKEAVVDPDTGDYFIVQGPLKIGQERQELLDLVLTIANTQSAKVQQTQLMFGADGSLVTTLQMAPPKKKKQESDLTPEEKARVDRLKLIKQQMQLFSSQHPELVDRNSIRYPIRDELLLELPELHGVCPDPKPEPLRILVSADEFEQLIYIWEFCNNFNDFLNTPSFKLEELKAALCYSEQNDPNANLTISEEQELDWNEQMRVKHIREKGLHMVNMLHTSLVNCFLQNFFPDQNMDEVQQMTNTRAAANAQAHVQLIAGQGEQDNQILQAIYTLIENKDIIWPEIIRLVFLYRMEHEGEDFGPNKGTMDSVLKKLAGLRPEKYHRVLSFVEKVTLLTVMIDDIHDTDTFRKFLNDRVEEKSNFNKEKIEVYQAIRQLEQDQQQLAKEHQEKMANTDEEQVNKELENLKEQLRVCSRTQSKEIRERILSLEADKKYFREESARLEELVKKRHAQIAKLNEKLYKSAIKTTMLGQDAHRSEYWLFKDDCSRIYIRKEEQGAKPDVEMLDREEVINTHSSEPSQAKYSWFYYEHEDQLDQLIERLSFRGIRERRLQDSLRRIKDILKLRKTRKPKVADNQGTTDQVQSEDKAEMKVDSVPAKETEEADGANDLKQEDAEDDGNGEGKEEGSEKRTDRHVMFETDDADVCFAQAIWFGQRIPGKRRTFGRGANKASEGSEFGPNLVTLQKCKNILVRIQNLYTESSKNHDREWSDKTERDHWLKQVSQARNCHELTALMKRLDEGMCLPYHVAQRGNQTTRMKLQMFKFWPSTDLKEAWQTYVDDSDSTNADNLNALFIILRMLESINEQFMHRQEAKMEKKTKAAINAAQQSEPEAKKQVFPLKQRTRDANYVKYFQSSESEEEESPEKDVQMESEDDESEEEEDRTIGAKSGKSGKSVVSARHQRAQQRGKPAPKQTGGKRRKVESESEDSGSEEKDSSQQSWSSDEESEEEQKQRGRLRGKANERSKGPANKARAQPAKGRKRVLDDSDESDESVESESDESGSEEQSRSWDEYCFVCQDGGNVLCCDGCSQVAHLRCLKLKNEPKEDWFCPECLERQTKTRLTRQRDNKNDKKKSVGKDRHTRPTRSHRRY